MNILGDPLALATKALLKAVEAITVALEKKVQVINDAEKGIQEAQDAITSVKNILSNN